MDDETDTSSSPQHLEDLPLPLPYAAKGAYVHWILLLEPVEEQEQVQEADGACRRFRRVQMGLVGCEKWIEGVENVETVIEASKSTLVLEDDNPNAVDGVLRYLYELDPMESCGSPLPAVTLKHAVYPYATADKYDAPHLRGEMLSSFKDRAERLWQILW
ncbi:hypothetical protein IFR05_010494 [Cadophora sp. M221]|nr:hypothetical protein IFR05_010494 [Cadophora sp. M221]